MPNEYTDREIRLIREIYPDRGSHIPEVLRRHSSDSIIAEANRIGVHFGREFTWGKNVNPPPEWCRWFSGFFDGEGCFVIRTGARLRKRGWTSLPSCGLTICIRCDDWVVIEEIKKMLKIGTITRNNLQSRRDKGERVMDSCSWNVHSAEQLLKVMVPLFERFPLKTKKAREFLIWKRAVEIKFSGQYGREEYKEKLIGLQGKLEKLRRGASRRVENFVKSGIYEGISHPNSKLSKNDVRRIRRMLDRGKLSMGEIAQKFKVQRTTIWSIAHRENWKWLE